MQTPKTVRMLPSATVSNTWGLAVGGETSDAHVLVGEAPPEDGGFIQATASGQTAVLTMAGPFTDLPEGAAVLGVRVTLRARSVGVGSGSLRVEPLTDLVDNNDSVVSRVLSVAAADVAEVSAFFPAQERVLGEFDRWEIGAPLGDDPATGLYALSVRLRSEHATNHVRVTHVRADVVWAEAVTLDHFFKVSPGTLGWSALGTGVESFSKGVLRMEDTSGVSGFRYNRSVVALQDFGVASIQLEAAGVWTADGVFAINAVTANIGAQYLQVNLLKDGGVAKVGLLKGPPSSFDPKLIGSYVVTAAYPWDTALKEVWVWLRWDPTTVYVYVGGDFSAPIFQVARTLVSAGPSGAFLEFGTLSDAPTDGSQGTALVQRVVFRGLGASVTSRVVMDWQTRQELSSGSGFQTTTLVWHHSGATFDAFKIRAGGGTEGTGYFIPTADGSANTENLATSVPPNTPVLTTVSHGDLLRNDTLPEGDRELVIYTRNAVTKVWSVYGVDAAVVPIRMFKGPPQVTVDDFLVGQDGTVRLRAAREFRVFPVSGVFPPGQNVMITPLSALPVGMTQAVDIITPDLQDQQGSAASLSPGSPGNVIVAGLTGLLPESVGRKLALTGGASAGNRGLFPIVSFISTNAVEVENALAVPGDANNGALIWQEQALLETDRPVYEAHQDGLPVVPTEVLLDPDVEAPLASSGIATLMFVVLDAYNQQELRVLSLNVRTGTPFEEVRGDAGYRFAVPAVTRGKDPILADQYLPVWDAVLYQWQRITSDMRLLLDPQLAPLDALKLMFQEMGLLYPSVPGYPEAALRRLLDNADAIHRSRYSLAGLRFYLGLLIPNASVDIAGFPRGFFFFLNAPDLGFPTLAMIQTAQTDVDVCVYLFGPVDFFGALTVYVSGSTVSGQLGVAASVVDSGTPGEPLVTGLTGMTVDSVGHALTLSGVGDLANRGTFLVTAYVSPTSVRILNPAAVPPAIPDPRNTLLQWQERLGAVVSAEMKELIKEVLRREIPMSDDPVSPRSINLVFVPS